MTRVLLLSLAGTALGLVLLLLRRVLRGRLPAAFYHAAWLLVLLRLMLPLPGLVPVAAESAAAPTNIMSTAARADAAPRSYHYANEGYREAGGFAAAEAAAEQNTAPAAADTPALIEDAPAGAEARDDRTPLLQNARELLRSERFWLCVWAAGAALTLLWTVLSYRRFCRAIRPTLITPDGATARVYAAFPMKRKPVLLRSPYVKTPMLLGIARPLILLPGEPLPPATAENVLRHELTHYRRGDLVFKWFSALVFSLHWFNPFMLLFRRELDRVCELSCDERVLRSLDREKQKKYGETLLDLAAGSALPVGVVATTFSTTKRDLKERLEHIMRYRKFSRAALALTVAALLLLTGCAAALAPAVESRGIRISNLSASAVSQELAPTPAPAADDGHRTVTAEPVEPLGDVTVSTVDELLAAIAPCTTVHLTAGKYDLSEASDYGESRVGGHYTWEKSGDGYELVIEGVAMFSIVYDGAADEAVIAAVPRSANVLTFRECAQVTLAGFTAGHTIEPGSCTGGVISLEGTDDVRIEGCELYGCGILGVSAENCRHVTAADTVIRDCSDGAVSCTSCYDVQLIGCDVYGCGKEYAAWRLFEFKGCYAAALINCDIRDNRVSKLLDAAYSEAVSMRGCLVRDNDLDGGTMFSLERYGLVVDGCAFRDNIGSLWSAGDGASVTDAEGRVLTAAALQSMEQASCGSYTAPALPDGPVLERVQREGLTEITVSNVDELLAAIGPDTIIRMQPGTYDLSTASHYGAYGGEYYYWRSAFEGSGLVITDVENLAIEGAGREDTRLLAVPRSVDVLTFERCENIVVAGLEAGHTEAVGGCGGAVLRLIGTYTVDVTECGLFGCGRLGIRAEACALLNVTNTEIYECSNGGVTLDGCADCRFVNCAFRDNGGANYSVTGRCANITADGVDITNGGPDVVVEPWMFERVFLSDSPQPPFVLGFLIDGETLENGGELTMRVGQTLKLGTVVPAEYETEGAQALFQHYDDGFVSLDDDGTVTALAPGDDMLLAGYVLNDEVILCFGILHIHVSE